MLFLHGPLRLRTIAFALVCFALGSVACSMRLATPTQRALHVSNQQLNSENLKKSLVCGRITHIQGLPDRRLRISLSRLIRQNKESDYELPGNAVWTWENPDGYPLVNQVACVSARITPVSGFSNFGVPGTDIFWRMRGVQWRLWSRKKQGDPHFEGSGSWASRVRQRLINGITGKMTSSHEETLPHLSAGKAIVMALLFGDRFYIENTLAEAFGDASLAHSLALSGQHLGVAIIIGFLCVSMAGKIYPRIYLFMPRNALALLAACPFALCYLWLGNAPPSLMRAATMLFILTFSVLRKKPATPTDLIFLALLCLSMADPLNVFDIGLELSFLCVIIIALVLPWLAWMRAWQKRMSPRRAGRISVYLLQILFVSFAVQVALSPVNLMLFHRLGIYFPLNLLWIPAISLIVIPLAACALILKCLHLDALCSIALEMASLPCQWLADFLASLQDAGLLWETAYLRPHWTSLIGYAAIMGALALLAPSLVGIPKKKIRILLLAGIAMLYVAPCLRIGRYFSDDLRLEAFDVGQGQALALIFPHGRQVVLDGGGSYSSRFDPGKSLVAPALSWNAAPRIAAVLNSHPDQDHLGGLFYLLDKFKVEAVIHNGHDAAGAQKERWRKIQVTGLARQAASGQIFQPAEACRDSAYLEILHPAGDSAWIGNNASIVARLVRNGKGLALFTGDVELPALHRLLSSGAELEAKVLIAPHHGSDSSFLADFYEKVRPELVLICCGFANRYNYPGKKLRKYLEKNGIKWLDTGTKGQIRIYFQKSGDLKITSSRAG